MLAALVAADPKAWALTAALFLDADLSTLLGVNRKWFPEPMGLTVAVGTIWLVNLELTRRGIAPAWRGLPKFLTVKAPPPVNPNTPDFIRLGDTMKRSLMRRWVDIEWLRSALGPTHLTTSVGWREAFSADYQAAVRGFAKVNNLRMDAGRPRPVTPFKTLYRLNVPGLHRRALEGLVDRDAGEARVNAQKRVRESIRPKMVALMLRPTYRLTQAEVDRRLIFCEAIELAKGSPTDASLFFKWMTGETVSRQTMHEMRNKIAVQCKLTTQAWTRT